MFLRKFYPGSSLVYIPRKDVLDPYWFPEGLPALRLSMSNEAERLFSRKQNEKRTNNDKTQSASMIEHFFTNFPNLASDKASMIHQSIIVL